MKKATLLIASAALLLTACGEQKQCNKCTEAETNPFLKQEIVSVPRGEQAPRATPGQNNFGGMILPPAGNNQNRPRPAQTQQLRGT